MPVSPHPVNLPSRTPADLSTWAALVPCGLRGACLGPGVVNILWPRCEGRPPSQGPDGELCGQMPLTWGPSAQIGLDDRATSPMHRRCTSDVGDALAISASRTSGSASSRIANSSAMQRDPPNTSTRTPVARPGMESQPPLALFCATATTPVCGEPGTKLPRTCCRA
eukprot:1708839-Pyramimonas_sp.AAC.1